MGGGRAAADERFEVELKSERRVPLNDPELVEAVICLANGAGGTLLVGVKDDGRITGAGARQFAHGMLAHEIDHGATDYAPLSGAALDGAPRISRRRERAKPVTEGER